MIGKGRECDLSIMYIRSILIEDSWFRFDWCNVERLLRWLDYLQEAQTADAARSPTAINLPATDGRAGIQVAAAKQHEEHQQQQQQQTELPDKSAAGLRRGSVGLRNSDPAAGREDSGGGGSGFVNSLFGCFGHRGHAGANGRNRRRGT